MDKPRLLYFADAMCSWCYGFAPEMARIKAHFDDSLDHLTFSGGLRPFNTEEMEAGFRDQLAGTYDRIENLTGQSFANPKSLTPGFIYDTEPASRAVVTMRHMKPGADYPYMLAIQQAFYQEGSDITDADVLAGFATLFGVDEAEFARNHASEAMKAATMQDFQIARQFNIDGFPTLIVHKREAGENKLMLVAKGFDRADEIIDRIEAALSHDG